MRSAASIQKDAGSKRASDLATELKGYSAEDLEAIKDKIDMVFKGRQIKILVPEIDKRIDMGKYCVGENGHESWATKLKFKRLDGDSKGPIRAGHDIAILSPEANKRLDIGKIEDGGGSADADHHSWATYFQLKPTGDHGDEDPITYETEFFIESPEEGGKYMDIGPAASEDVDHDSWATKFKVAFVKEEDQEISRNKFKEAIEIAETNLYKKGAIFKSSEIKLLVPEIEKRIDMGKYCAEENGHKSWATKLKFKRLDGDSEGPIRAGHEVAIFSPEANKRLDIGKIEDGGGSADPDHHSWATYFKLKPTGDHDDGQPLTYDTEFHIESPDEEGKYMDIGPAASDEMEHDSWATKFKVAFEKGEE